MEEAQSILDPGQFSATDNPKRLITLGPNDQVPLEEIWREADPLCRYCHRGLQEVVGGPRRVCGCAVRNIMRRRYGQTPSAPLARVVKTPAGEEHARKKLERLRHEAAKQREEIEERIRGYDAGVDEAMAAVAQEEDKLREAVLGVEQVAAGIKRLDDDWDKAVDAFKERERQYWASASNARGLAVTARTHWEAHKQAHLQANQALDAIKARAQWRLDDAAGARARLEKLERRIALHLGLHPELGGEAKS